MRLMLDTVWATVVAVGVDVVAEEEEEEEFLDGVVGGVELDEEGFCWPWGGEDVRRGGGEEEDEDFRTCMYSRLIAAAAAAAAAAASSAEGVLIGE